MIKIMDTFLAKVFYILLVVFAFGLAIPMVANAAHPEGLWVQGMVYDGSTRYQVQLPGRVFIVRPVGDSGGANMLATIGIHIPGEIGIAHAGVVAGYTCTSDVVGNINRELCTGITPEGGRTEVPFTLYVDAACGTQMDISANVSQWYTVGHDPNDTARFIVPGCPSTSPPPPTFQCSDAFDNDGDGLRDYPADPGCTFSQDNDESNASVICSTNSQCGTNGLVGTPYCSGIGVYQLFKTYICNNPGTINSSCSDSSSPQLQTTCQTNQTCNINTATCVTNVSNLAVSCSASPNPALTNQQVNFTGTATGGTGGYAYQWSVGCSAFNSQNCSTLFPNPGSYTSIVTVTSGNQTAAASCSVTVNQSASQFQCSDGLDNDGDGLRDYPADPGCTFSQDNDESNVSVICSTNSQCGTNGLVGTPYCSGIGVYQLFKTYICNNPGTINSSCSDSSSPQLQTTCQTNQTCNINTATCVTNVSNLAVSCSASPNPALTNQQVNFTGTATGGTGGYAYQWSVGCSAFNSQNCSTLFPNPGSYTSIVTVTSGNQTAAASCSVTVNQSASQFQCSDGLDNDGDGLRDYPADPGCTFSQDNDESNVSVICSTNSQCGTNGLVGTPYCSGIGVYQLFKTYICNNPGTINSSCSDSSSPQLQTTCQTNQTCNINTATCVTNVSNLAVSCSASP